MPSSGEYPTKPGSNSEPFDDGQSRRAMCSILLVEDHDDTREALAGLLRSWGHEVSTGESAARGLAFLADHGVDVILSDIGLPDKDGYAFIAEVRKKNSEVKAIAMSAYFTPGDQRRCREAGFDMYYPKPLDLLSLQMVLARLDPEPETNRVAPEKKLPNRAA